MDEYLGLKYVIFLSVRLFLFELKYKFVFYIATSHLETVMTTAIWTIFVYVFHIKVTTYFKIIARI